MYCIKCGKDTKNAGILCKDCEETSGFQEKEQDSIKERKQIGFYLAVLGNLAILIGLLSSFILIKTDAPTDYVAKIFRETATGPVETAEDESNTDTSEDGTDEEQEVIEVKGYSYSIASYIRQKKLPEDAKEEENILKTVADYVEAKNLAPVNLSDSETKNMLEQYFDDDKTMQVLEDYSKSSVQGNIVLIVAVVALVMAVYQAFKKDFKWSMLYSFIATCPVWLVLAKLNGITQWEFQSGMYFFIAGIFIVLAAGLTGSNTDRCKSCNTELPGGALYCYKCGSSMTNQKTEDENKRSAAKKEDAELDEQLKEQLNQ